MRSETEKRVQLWASGAYKAVIGGMGNLFYYGEYVCAFGVAVAGVLGSKKALKIFRTLIE